MLNLTFAEKHYGVNRLVSHKRWHFPGGNAKELGPLWQSIPITPQNWVVELSRKNCPIPTKGGKRLGGEVNLAATVFRK